MILREKTVSEFGYDPDTCSGKKKVYRQCDYCGFINLASKKNILASRKIIEKDSCGDKKCMSLKRKESNLVQFGVESFTQTEQLTKSVAESWACRTPEELQEIDQRRKQTSLERYGTERPSQSQEVKDRIANTCMERYGVPNPALCDDFFEKSLNTNTEKHGDLSSWRKELSERAKRTSQEKYGVDHYSQTEEYRLRVKKTSNEKFGCDSYSQTSQFRESFSNTCQEKYGVDYPSQTKWFQEKRRNTCQERYGADHYNKTELYRQSVRETCLEKYGVEHFSKVPEIRQKAMKTAVERYGSLCGKTEREIREWLCSFGKEFRPDYNLVPGKEIDLFCPELNLAVEYCGLYWHNENSPEPRKNGYHLNKLNHCQKKGVRLITLFEDEWIFRREQVKNFLSLLVAPPV